MALYKRLQHTDHYLKLVLMHVALAFALRAFRPLAKLYFIVLVVYFLKRIITAASPKVTQEVLLACAYVTGAEVLFRMTKGALSYEGSKYLVIVFVLIGMIMKGASGRGMAYIFYLLALVPAVIMASFTLTAEADFRKNILFVLSGPICLGFAALFCYDRKVSQRQLLDVIMYMSLPCIAMTVYLFLYNPSIKDALSGTASNAAASGGFGPNQVSTMLGLGMFTMVVRFFMKSPTLILKIFNLGILAAMAFRAIVTFSRGGVFTAIIVIAAFLWVFFFRANVVQKGRIIGLSVVFVIAGILTWGISSSQTEGLIDKRYNNEDALGREKGDVSTGRLQLFEEELEGFFSSPVFGIGASRIKDQRIERGDAGLPSHNEVGRLLAEHGSFGLMILLLLIFTPLIYRAGNRKNYFFYAFLCFWFATINHSGMRIAAPAFLYALSLIHVTYEKRPVRRKPIRA